MTRRNTLLARFCDADERRTNEALGNLAELTLIETLPALAQVEYQNAWAEGVKNLFDQQDFWNWTKVKP
jgi:hypothetical protein